MRYWYHNIARGFENRIVPKTYTSENAGKLRRLLKGSRGRRRGGSGAACLLGQLGAGRVVAPRQIACDVLTVNSQARIRAPLSRQSVVITLVLPEAENAREGRISVSSPLGAALLGSRVGEDVEYRARSGTKSVRIERLLYQPEAMGRYSA